MNLQEQIQHDFRKYLAHENNDSSEIFAQLRHKAIAEFEKTGLPNIKNEEWKYTNLRNISSLSFNSSSDISNNAKKLLNENSLNAIKANHLVFINGRFYNDLSNIIENDKSIIISNLETERKNNSVHLEKHFGKYAKIEGEGLNAMNTALLNDGVFVYVPINQKVEHPILITNIVDATEFNVLSQPRNLILVEKNSSVQIIENYLSTGINASFTNVVNEIFVDENAKVEHYKIQQQCGESYQNNFTQFFQNTSSNINQVTLTLDGALIRNNLHFYMNGENCNSLLYGFYLTEKNNHIDNHTRVDHASPNCYSDEKYKGILKDESTAVFNGKIIVHVDAQKTNAYQRNQNILLSETATINTKPQLEIFADDVKCTHGATIGRLDDEQLFYLQSRGISKDSARRILLNAFADEIAERIKIPELVQILEAEIEKKL